ncbi:MAG: hypothetical protein EOO71_04555 [Myxococcaceae bacterium]|nr:MAG: hypothetical protein EOO71_04555 [Myxococcaceae bacterium]
MAHELPGCSCIDEETRVPAPLVGHAAGPLTYGFEGLGRLVQLGVAALGDMNGLTPGWKQGRLEAFLCLSSEVGLDTPWAPLDVAQRMMGRLQEETGWALPPGSIHLSCEERGGTVRALAEAARRLRARQCDTALVLACDSLVSPERTERLLDQRRLKTPDHPVGFMPGEAGVAILLERYDSVRGRGVRPHGLLFDPVIAQEPHCLAAKSPPTGRALAEVLTQALVQADAREATAGDLYLDLNGENFRASEWGHTRVRTQEWCGMEAWAQRIPALNFGETGAASPLLAVCLAARAFARKYSRGDHALVLSSGDDGHRSGIILDRVPTEQGLRH